jgi:hypothetical protein
VRVAIASGLLAALATFGRGASADNIKGTCAHAAEVSQRLRDDGKPLAARDQLLACARPACPAIVRSRCGAWLEQTDAAIPTVVIKARAGPADRAMDVTDVRVAIDGVPTLASLDGQPLRLEPGRHTLRFTRAGVAPVEVTVLLMTGEKNRLLTADFVKREVTPAPGPAPYLREAARPARDAPPSPAEGGTTVRPAAWVFAGLAVVAGGSFAYFGATGKSELDSLHSGCAGHCDPSAVSAAWNKLIVADVSLAAGLASVGVATWLFLWPRRTAAAQADAAPTGLLVGPDGHGLQVGWRGAF